MRPVLTCRHMCAGHRFVRNIAVAGLTVKAALCWLLLCLTDSAAHCCDLRCAHQQLALLLLEESRPQLPLVAQALHL